MSSFLEQRSLPLGTTFLTQKEVHYPGSEPAALRKSWALRKFAPSRLRRHHSLGGFIPYALAELPALKTGSSLKSTNPAVVSDGEGEEVLVPLWPDTDSDREDAPSRQHSKAKSFGAFCQQDTSEDCSPASQPPMLQLRCPPGYAHTEYVAEPTEPDASRRSAGHAQESPTEQFDASTRTVGGSALPVFQLSLASHVGCNHHARSPSLRSIISPCDVRLTSWTSAGSLTVTSPPPGAWEHTQRFPTQASMSDDHSSIGDGHCSSSRLNARSENGSDTKNSEQCEAKITTLMIRNLPSHVTQILLLEELDRSGFGDLCDFAYMPMSFDAKTGKGYAFVNFVSQAAAGMFVGAWHETRRFGIRGTPLNISPALIQGLEDNIRKWAGPRMNRIRNPALRPFIARPQTPEAMQVAQWSSAGPAKPGQESCSPAAHLLHPVAAGSVVRPATMVGNRTRRK